MRPLAVISIVAAGTAAADLVSKALFFGWLRGFRRLEVVEGFFAIAVSRNTGGLFGVGQGRTWIFILFSFVAIGVVIWMYLTMERPAPTLISGMGCILGGAVGNLYDRIRYGSVRDFLDFYLGSWHWPTFNLADVFISVGAALLIWHAWHLSGHQAKE